jgi:hypothetical protein
VKDRHGRERAAFFVIRGREREEFLKDWIAAAQAKACATGGGLNRSG